MPGKFQKMPISVKYRKQTSGYSGIGLLGARERKGEWVEKGIRKHWGMGDVFIFLIVKMLSSMYT